MHKYKNNGIVFGLLAGVFWGTTFLAPLILYSFTPLEITFGRFFVFGLISILNIQRAFKLLKSLTKKDVLTVIILSITGFWLYTITLFTGIRLTNGIVAPLIVGCLPLTVIICGNPKVNLLLITGLCLNFSGLLVLLVLPFLFSNTLIYLSAIHLSGIFLLIFALIMWTWFALTNSKFIKLHVQIKPDIYTSLMGIINLIFLVLIFMSFENIISFFHHKNLLQFILCSMVLGIGASWLANIFWAYCAKKCSTSISGVLIISETVFGLIYSFIFEHRLPHLNEIIAIILLISGIIVVINSQKVGAEQQLKPDF